MDQSTRTDSGTCDHIGTCLHLLLLASTGGSGTIVRKITDHCVLASVSHRSVSTPRTSDGHGDERRIDDRHDTPLHGSNKCLQIPLFAASVQPSDGAPTRSCLPTPGCWAPLVKPMF